MDNGHDTLDHRDTDLMPGSSDDTEESTNEVKKYNTRTTTDSAPNYLLNEYRRPKEVKKSKDNLHYDHHTRRDGDEGALLSDTKVRPGGSVREHALETG